MTTFLFSLTIDWPLIWADCIAAKNKRSTPGIWDLKSKSKKQIAVVGIVSTLENQPQGAAGRIWDLKSKLKKLFAVVGSVSTFEN